MTSAISEAMFVRALWTILRVTESIFSKVVDINALPPTNLGLDSFRSFRHEDRTACCHLPPIIATNPDIGNQELTASRSAGNQCLLPVTSVDHSNLTVFVNVGLNELEV